MRNSVKLVIGAVLAGIGGLLIWWQTQPVQQSEAIVETVAEPAVVAPVAAPEIQSEPQTDPAPQFDVVRVSPEGQAVIAGQATPGELVEILLDGEVIGTAAADATGSFATVLDVPPSNVARELTLRTALSDVPAAVVALAPNDLAGDTTPAGSTGSEGATAETASTETIAAEKAAEAVVATERAAAENAAAAAEKAAVAAAAAERAAVEQTAKAAAAAELTAAEQAAEAAAATAAEQVTEAVTGVEASGAGQQPETETGAADPGTGGVGAVAEAAGGAIVGAADTPATETTAATEAAAAEAEAEAAAVAKAEAEAAASAKAEAEATAVAKAEAEAAAAAKAEAEAAAAAKAEAEAAAAAKAEVEADAAAKAEAEAAATAMAEAEAAAAARAKAEAAAAKLAADLGAGSVEPEVSRYVLSAPVIILPQEEADQAPLLVKPAPEGVVLLQPAQTEPAAGIVLDQITYSPLGDLMAAGRGRPGAIVRVYANASFLEEIHCDETGRWETLIDAKIASAALLLRFDEVDSDGAVISRLETPFDYSPAATTQELRQREIVVQKGDNLWTFAEQHYGQGIRYSIIFGANSGLIRDPDLIYPGQVFSVPELVNSQ